MHKYLIAFLMFAGIACAQTAPFALMPVPRQQFFSPVGQPLAGGLIFTYIAGTNTPQATYTDSTGTIQNTNPIILDAGGFATIWLGGTSYKIVAQNSLGQQQWTVDNVSDVGQILYTKAVLLSPAASALQTILGPLGANYFQQSTLHFTSPGVRVSILDPLSTLDTFTNPPTLTTTNPAGAGQNYQIPDPTSRTSNLVLSPGAPDWQATTAQVLGYTIVPYTNNPCSFTFKVTKAGTSGATNPVFSTTPCASSVATANDGQISWTSLGLVVPTNTLDCTKSGINCIRSSYTYFEGAGCNNTTPSLGWDTFGANAPTPLCITGTNIQKGVMSFPAAATWIQENTGTGAAATTCTTTYTSGTTAGDLLEVEVAVDGGKTVSGVTDGTNAYTKAVNVQNGNYDSEIWYFNGNSTAKAASTTLTVTLSAAANCALDWKEYSGVLTASALDKTASNTGTGTTATTGTTLATTQATELMVSAIAASGAPSIFPDVHWVSHAEISQSTNVSVISAGLIQQAVGTESSLFVLSSSATWASTIATFKVNVAAPVTAQRQLFLPPFFNSTLPINAFLKWQTVQPHPNTQNTIQFGTAVSCTPDGSTDDAAAFNTPTQQTLTVNPTASGGIISSTSFNGLTSNACAASNLLHFQLQRLRYTVGDTFEGVIYVDGAGLSFGINQ